MAEKKRIMVAGGAGFIGSNLCEYLLEKENEIICIDNFITGRKENIEKLKHHQNFSVLERNITKRIEIDGNIDEIYHLASLASPPMYQKYPIETLLVGSRGTKNLLDLAEKKSSKFLFTSTSEVYGDPEVHPQPESYWGKVNCIGLRSCYDESKRYAEALIMAYNRTRKIDSRIVRIFNTYGPKMRIDDGRVVTNFINQALHNKNLVIYGNGEQTRSFCYISDLVDGLVKTMESNYSNPINLGNTEEYTIKEVAKIIVSLTNSNSKTKFTSMPEDDPKKRNPNISLARRELNWSPRISFEEGLKKTIEYFKSLNI